MKRLSEMTLQEIFDTVWNGFVAQDWELGWNPKNSTCVYRTKNGFKCAAGHLLPDEEYEASFYDKPEATDIMSLVRSRKDNYFKRELAGDYDRRYLVSDIQEDHDTVAVCEYATKEERTWALKDRLVARGQKYGLQVPA